MENARQISQKLMPPLLQNHGLSVAMEDYLSRLAKTSEVNFCFESTGKFASNPNDYEIFRILQEFANNIIRHGNASHCTVRIAAEESDLCVEIIDDGTKFDFWALSSSSRGAGISNIVSRLNVAKAGLQQIEVLSGNHFILTANRIRC
mgnify:CR=1 FL=1